MAYSKTTWATGDVIDAAKLNNIEDGIAANDTAIAGLAPYAVEGTMGVDADENQTITLDKKAGECYTASAQGRSFKCTIALGENSTGEAIFYPCAVKNDNAGIVTYSFRIVSEYGVGFSVTGLAATDTVVLTAES